MMLTIDFRRRDLEKSSFRLVLSKKCIEEGNVGIALISRLNTYETTKEEKVLISSFAQQVIDALKSEFESEKSNKGKDNVDDIVDTTTGSIEIVLPEYKNIAE